MVLLEELFKSFECWFTGSYQILNPFFNNFTEDKSMLWVIEDQVQKSLILRFIVMIFVQFNEKLQKVWIRFKFMKIEL